MSKQLDEKAAEALRKLGHTEEEIAELAQKQKALPTEENVAEKEETAHTPERSTIWAELGKMLGIGQKEVAPVASMPEEARKAEEVTAPANAAEPAEKQQAEGDKPAEKAEPDGGALIQALGETVAKSIGAMVRQELDERDKRIAALEATIKGLSETVEEKVEQRLRDLPQVVKVAASQAAATAVEEKPKGLTFGQRPDEAAKFYQSLVGDIQRVVEDKVGAQFKV